LLFTLGNIRCFEDEEYKEAGAELCDRINESDNKTCILGIKPLLPDQILANTTYMFYSRIANGLEATKPLKEKLIAQKCTLIDYERVTDKNGRGIVGK